MIENKHLANFSAPQAFKINYLFKHKKIIDAFTSEFEKTVEKSWGQPLFCNSIPELRYDHVSVFRNIDFDSLNTPIVKLRNLAFEFLNENRPFCVSAGTLKSLVHSIQDNYRYVPYHNFAHGFSVMHLFHILSSKINVDNQLFDKTTLFACYLACLAHDLGHRSKNNAYNTSVKSKYALVSFNQSVMEKHHVKRLFKLLKSEKMDVFANYSVEELANSRSVIIENILATDILNHHTCLKKLESLQIGNQPTDNLLVGKILTQAADIGNSTANFANYLDWARLITQEFDSQTVAEDKRSLKINEFMKYSGVRNFIDNQIGFSSEIIRDVSSSTL